MGLVELIDETADLLDADYVATRGGFMMLLQSGYNIFLSESFTESKFILKDAFTVRFEENPDAYILIDAIEVAVNSGHDTIYVILD